MKAIPTVMVLSLIMPVALTSAPAWAANIKSRVNVTSATDLDPGGVKVKGNVKSKNAACVKGRKVKVYHDVAPEGPSPGDFLLGEVTTNDNGKWSLTTPFEPDRVYARAGGKKAGADKCRPARSNTVDVD